MSIVTDSDGERPENVYAIHKLIKSEEELDSVYKENEGRYGDLKKILIEDLESFIAPMREKRDSISDDDVKEVLAAGAEKAKVISSPKLEEVRKATGINL